MDVNEQPLIATEQSVIEFSLRGIILAIILSVVLAVSNAFLALKIGILTSASIPAAIISMGILRFFKNSTILENNLVQTAASAGEAVAGGIVYTLPALIIIGYWHEFSYWQSVCIALFGGLLGVFFSIPLRRILVTDESLHFPEGRAIAEVLKISNESVSSVRHLLFGGLAGGAIELAQTGFKVIANSWQVWFVAKRALFGFGAGFSAAMIGAGYLIGFNLSASIMIGAVIAWLLSVPLISEFYLPAIHHGSAAHLVMQLWEAKIRYIGIGAMVFAGLWTLLHLTKPFYMSIKTSLEAFKGRTGTQALPRTDRDMPLFYIVFGILFILVALYFLFLMIFPLSELAHTFPWQQSIIISSLFYILIIGFISCALTAYFSGMVGVTATPGSSIIIASILIAGLLLLSLLEALNGETLLLSQATAGEVVVIIMGAIITGAAAISNDNMQDLKVGYLLGATPWKQQVMMILGVVTSSLVIPPIMQMLFEVYGIAGVMPQPGMDISQSLPAPPAALMAAITQAVFQNNLPWDMIYVGGGITLACILANRYLKVCNKKLSILGIAIGIYLPLASSTPIFIGGLIALLTQRGLQKVDSQRDVQQSKQRGILLACGLVAGAALMDVILAVPFSIAHSPDVIKLAKPGWAAYSTVLGALTTVALSVWFYKVVCKNK